MRPVIIEVLPRGFNGYHVQSSPLASPYSVREHGREEATRLYRAWLASRLVDDERVRRAMDRLTSRAHRTRYLALVCDYAPHGGYGVVIAEEIEGRLRELGDEVEVRIWGLTHAPDELLGGG